MPLYCFDIFHLHHCRPVRAVWLKCPRCDAYTRSARDRLRTRTIGRWYPWPGEVETHRIVALVTERALESKSLGSKSETIENGPEARAMSTGRCFRYCRPLFARPAHRPVRAHKRNLIVPRAVMPRFSVEPLMEVSGKGATAMFGLPNVAGVDGPREGWQTVD